MASAQQQFCLKWNNHQGNFITHFDQLQKDGQYQDVTMSCEGKSIRCHRVVLSACSTYFHGLFQDNPCKHPILIMNGMKWGDLKSIVEFMYKGEINVSQDKLSALLKTAESLKIKGLADVPQASELPKSMGLSDSPAPAAKTAPVIANSNPPMPTSKFTPSHPPARAQPAAPASAPKQQSQSMNVSRSAAAGNDSRGPTPPPAKKRRRRSGTQDSHTSDSNEGGAFNELKDESVGLDDSSETGTASKKTPATSMTVELGPSTSGQLARPSSRDPGSEQSDAVTPKTEEAECIDLSDEEELEDDPEFDDSNQQYDGNDDSMASAGQGTPGGGAAGTPGQGAVIRYAGILRMEGKEAFCNACNKTSKNKIYLKDHYRTEHLPVPFAADWLCSVCPVTNRWAASASYHLSTAHTGRNATKYIPCPKCMTLFTTTDIYVDHVFKEHLRE